MAAPVRIALLFAAAALCAALGVSRAEQTPGGASTIDTLNLPLPAAAPGPAYPRVDEVNMVRFCRRQSNRVRYYPQRAVNQGVEGLVVLDCAWGADGSPAACQVLHEAPSDFGFGDAALRIGCYMRADPSRMVEGERSPGLPQGSSCYRRNGENEPWRVRVPIRFQLSD